MPQVQTDNVKPCNPFIDFTTTTSTTTLVPTLEYFLLPPSGSICPQDPCVCGSIMIPIGAKHSPSGSYISINDIRYPLVHNIDALLDKEQQFISTTTKLIPPQNSINLLTNNITINLGKELNLINVIQIIIKIRETKKIIGQNVIGSFDSSTSLSNINISLLETFNLANLTLQIEITSLCKNSKQVCCDALPSSVTLSNVINSIYCSTTLPPFCTSFNLPDTFYMTIRGYGFLEGQEDYNLVTRNGSSWETNGTFPCGANYYISMTCDPNTQSFIYDGYVDCCEEITKTIISPSQTPYLSPSDITPIIIWYTDCSCDLSCSQSPGTTGTTTSTTTDFPTTTPIPPTLPCEEINSLTINGYAFYRRYGDTVDIPGIGNLKIPRLGRHACNNTNFIPQIITKTKTISASPISLNNYPNGEDMTQTFSFFIDDASILKDEAFISLECQNVRCHMGDTWVILTTQIENETILLFNGSVLPSSIDDLYFKCLDCCDWDGAGFIQFNSICDGLSKSLQFYKIGDNLWECDADIDCGDRVNMIVKCNKDIEFNAEAPNLDQLCKQKWEIVNFNFPCAVNPRVTGNLLSLCDCDQPPIFELTADSINGCNCCDLSIDFLVLEYLFEDGNDLDTRTSISSGGENGPTVGWCRSMSYNGTNPPVPWYDFGGDNTGTGNESVLIYIKNIRDTYPNDNIVGKAAAMWFGNRVSGNITLTLSSYRGGTMSKTGYTWTNIGGELISSISINKNIQLVSRECSDEEIASFFTYTVDNNLIWGNL